MRRAITLAKAGAAATALGAVAASAWPGLVSVAGVTVILVVAACWVLANADRTERLTAIIRALRENRPARPVGTTRKTSS